MAAVPPAVSSILGPDLNNAETLLKMLMSPSNAERGQAEGLFEECKKHPDPLVTTLVLVLHHSQAQENRAMAAVLLRKVITKDQVSLWPQLSTTTQDGVKSGLLQCVQKEESKTICKKLCDSIAELAAGIFDEGLWPELLPFMFTCVQSQDDRLRWAALLIFSQLAGYLGSKLQPYLQTLHTVFKEGMSNGSSGDVRTAALRATTAFVSTLETSSERDKFQDLLPAMMQTLTVALNSGEEATAQEALEMFIEIAGTEPRFLRKQLVDVVAAMLQIAEAPQLEDSTRHLAVEFLVTLAEARDKAPGMMRKLPHLIGRLFAVLLNFLLSVEDDPKWHTADTEEEMTSDEDNYDVGMECLDRLAICLGGNTILPVASQLVPLCLVDQDWKKRHAGLIALAQIAEGCAKVLLKDMGPVVEMILTSLGDPHPRVRWAAINALGQLSTDLGPHLQKKFHARVLPALLNSMDDFQSPRVQAHASAAVLNFTENCAPEILEPYLDGLINKLLVLLQQGGRRMVQEGALTALASVADCAQNLFDKYYTTVMPYLKNILIHATDKPHRMLRAKSMECISLVGMAVGKDKFRADAKEVMDVLIKLQVADMDDDDPTISYMLQAWARLCKCLGQEFLPYMDVVMPPLLRSAQLKPDITVRNADSDNEDDDEEDESIETIPLGDKRIHIRTSVLEEKATACNMLCCYADELKEGFAPWVEQVTEIMVPLIKFYFHEEVRKAAVSAMPELLRSAELALKKNGQGIQQLKKLSDVIIGSLVENLGKEPEAEIVASMLESLGECIQVAGALLDPQQVKSIMDNFPEVISETLKRKEEKHARSKTEDFDEEEGEMLEEEIEQEDEVLEQLAECLGKMLKVYKAQLLPLVDTLLPFLAPLLGPKRPAAERRAVICIFDDLVEQTGEAGNKYFDLFMPAMLESATDAHADTRQAAVFGLGVCAQFCGARFRGLANEALGKLNAVISAKDAREEENMLATDNAISAVGKICEFQRDCIDAKLVLPAFLSCLPIKNDQLEAKIVHEYLLRLVEKSDPDLLGPGQQNLPKVIAVFAEVLTEKDLVSDAAAARIRALLRHLQNTLPIEVVRATFGAMQPAQQAALQSALSAQG